ncbi:hypothetical protein QTO34_000663 [Cnephaeus nilssonii]|uniref:KH type-2 domain-containing protein n=1 Tax=Cnephaeus nilssonii TaxID=3371016 RepID=A0AA40IC03_CNENI|nr:hypothetical protein QTO34_000663 [Eptesicus nilssonii]
MWLLTMGVNVSGTDPDPGPARVSHHPPEGLIVSRVFDRYRDSDSTWACYQLLLLWEQLLILVSRASGTPIVIIRGSSYNERLPPGGQCASYALRRRREGLVPLQLCSPAGSKMAVKISKKRKFVADGIIKAELNEFLTQELAEDGYSGVKVQVTPTKTEIIIWATWMQNVLGETGQQLWELTAMVQKKFGNPEGSADFYDETVATRGLCAIAQAESLHYKLLGGFAGWWACYGMLQFIIESRAKGCEIMVSGKHRGQRAKSMKFVNGLMGTLLTTMLTLPCAMELEDKVEKTPNQSSN